MPLLVIAFAVASVLCTLTGIYRSADWCEAARRLFISEATVKTHLLHIYAKLGVRDQASATGAGYQRGLLVPDQP